MTLPARLAALAVLAAVVAGCNQRPKQVRPVGVGELPESVTSQLDPAAKIESAQLLTFQEGNTMYRVRYTAPDGTQQSMDYNATDAGIDTPPARKGVFQP